MPVPPPLPPQPMPSASALSREAPWPGLASFTEQDAAYFHGREIETREVFRLIKRGPVTLLFGKSGLGKTSLLNAGLFPLLQDSGFAPIYVRLDHDDKSPRLADQVQSAIAARQPRTAQPTLWEFFHRMDDSAIERRALPVIVLDQFEEIFTLGRENVARRHRSAAFFTQLADLIQNNCPAEAQTRFDADRDARRQFDFDRQEFRVLIAMREEYLPFFEETRQPLRTLLPQRLRLIEMNGTQALDAIQQAGGHLFDQGVSESIVRFVAGADTKDDLTNAHLDDLELAPALLSLVCAELNDQRRRAGESKISQQLLSGRREQILTSFYERCFQGLDKEVRVFVEEQLLTTSGYRDSMAVEDAVRLKGVTQEAIEVLVERRLLRLDRRAGTSRVEITHDILIGACRRSRDARHLREQTWWAKVVAISAYVEWTWVFAFIVPIYVTNLIFNFATMFGMDSGDINAWVKFQFAATRTTMPLLPVLIGCAVWIARTYPRSGWNVTLGILLTLVCILSCPAGMIVVLVSYPLRPWNWILRVIIWTVIALLSLGFLVWAVVVGVLSVRDVERLFVVCWIFVGILYLLTVPAALSLLNLFLCRRAAFLRRIDPCSPQVLVQ